MSAQDLTGLRVLVTRPQPDADALAETLRAQGAAPRVEPMLILERRARLSAGGLDGAQAVLLSSANAARAVAEDGLGRIQTPAYCVGDRTAAAAAAAGFTSVRSASGDASDLLALARAELSARAGGVHVLRGAEAACDLAAMLRADGFETRETVLYAAEPRTAPLPAGLSAQTDAVLLMSPRTAMGFAALGIESEWVASAAAAVAISARAAAPVAPFFPDRLHVAERPTLKACLSRLAALAASRGD